MRVIRRAFIVCALAAGLWLQGLHAQAPSVSELAAQFHAAGEAERARIVASHPEFLDTRFREKFREEITTKGIDAVRRGDFALAEKYQLTVLWLGDHLNDDVIRAVAYVNLARTNGERGAYDVAQRYALDGIRLAEQLDDTESLQVAVANLGIIQRRLGDIDAALKTFERALALAEQLKLTENAARVVNNIGLAYYDLGDMSLAREYLDRSLAMKAQLGSSPALIQDIARGLNNIGMLYDELGDSPQALDHFQRAYKLLEGPGGPSLASAISNIGHVYLKMGERDRAREQFNRAMAIAEAQGDKPRIATVMYLLGYLDREAGLYAEAEATQRRALAIREETGEALGLIESLSELASLAMAGKRPAESYALASRAVTIATAARMPSRLWKAQTVAADALAAMQRDDEAIAAYQAGIKEIEALRQQTVGGVRGSQQYLGQRVGAYYGLARVHAKAGRPFDAFVAVERARARTLLDLVAAGRPSTRLLTPAQRQRERELSQAVVSASSQIDTMLARRKYEPAQLDELEARLSRAKLERDAYTTELYKSTPDLRIARGDAPIITREDLNALVKPGTAILSLVLDNQLVWAYVITRGSGGVTVSAKQVPITPVELVRLSEEFARQVATRDLGFSDRARKLYDLLFVSTNIEPLLNGKSHLVIVPDGPLWRVPFQALQTPRGTFLIEERAIAYSPSVSSLAALQKRRQSRSTREPYLLALGDPAIAVSASLPESSRKARGRLPQAAREVTALGQLYGAAKSRVLTGEQATERALRDNIGSATVMHVATHGVLDNLSPMYSHLLLAPVSEHSSESDGRLEAWELMNHPLNVDLAVLSACETARGPVGDGEGVIGLSWSLFAAGASTAVVSQWEVDSASTTALMIAFHERLLLSPRDGTQAAAPEALRVAAMRLMRGPAYRHPFYWAGFVVIGAS